MARADTTKSTQIGDSLLRRIVAGFLVLGTTCGFLLPIVYSNQAYAAHVFVPSLALALSEVLYRPPTKSFKDKNSRTSLHLLLTGFVGQLLGLILFFFDRKPFDVVENGEAFVGSAYSRAALLVQSVAAFMWLWSMRSLQGHFTANLEIVQGHRLINHGIYGFVRHPGYAASLLNIVSTSFALTRNVAFAGGMFLSLVIVYSNRIRDEERMLYRSFGKEYLEYRRRTADLLPFLGNLLAPSELEVAKTN
ncbi:Probable protein-S-isoprenylcysteine O-methyltransferase [Seminavis robusta]|uniref:Protein-S-isoprenylcysteine O-methyltransferase n=1 Tax=Seminavis robusta TaxID=568900 RepID=A0A9N8F2U0_9STRA|nr:Probable protein-S-isoprenylcysteine O-methyltransferase [Seminavis robusta]|eukprot:Sro2493_g329230.1 Probable protein-S-isoprenylcysteine O-methyltransferase (249) ;mRNA; r:7313-8059